MRILRRLSAGRWFFFQLRSPSTVSDARRLASDVAQSALQSDEPTLFYLGALATSRRWAGLARLFFFLFCLAVSAAVDLLGAAIPRPMWSTRRWFEQDGGALEARVVVGLRWLFSYAAVIEPLPQADDLRERARAQFLG